MSFSQFTPDDFRLIDEEYTSLMEVAAKRCKELKSLIFRNFLNNIINSCRVNTIVKAVRISCLVIFHG